LLSNLLLVDLVVSSPFGIDLFLLVLVFSRIIMHSNWCLLWMALLGHWPIFMLLVKMLNRSSFLLGFTIFRSLMMLTGFWWVISILFVPNLIEIGQGVIWMRCYCLMTQSVIWDSLKSPLKAENTLGAICNLLLSFKGLIGSSPLFPRQTTSQILLLLPLLWLPQTMSLVWLLFNLLSLRPRCSGLKTDGWIWKVSYPLWRKLRLSLFTMLMLPKESLQSSKSLEKS
jgi:hypothetical protein